LPQTPAKKIASLAIVRFHHTLRTVLSNSWAMTRQELPRFQNGCPEFLPFANYNHAVAREIVAPKLLTNASFAAWTRPC
jgi:hypothetical protein